MVRRVRSDDLELMATAISIQHTVGGNLAEILDSIAYTIRERVRIKGEIRTLTAQQRLSGYVVGFLPIGLAGFLFIAAPSFMDRDVPRTRRRSSGCRLGVVILALRRIHDVHRLHAHPHASSTSRSEQMPAILPILIAAAAAARHPAHRRHGLAGSCAGRPGPGPAAPSSGTMQAKNLEELELQQPFIERTLRPLASRLLRVGCRGSRARSFSETDREAARASPATRATCASPTGSASRRSARSCGAILFLLLFGVVGLLRLAARPAARSMPVIGLMFGYTIPEFWLGGRVKKRQHADPADDPGRPRPADDLRPGRPRLRRRARQGRREAQGSARPTSSAGRWPRSVSARRAARRSATSSRGPRSRR